MYDKDLAVHVLGQIYASTQVILQRFRPVGSVDDFTNSPAGMEKLDSICMQLIALGESLKNLDKITHGELLKQYPQVDWKKAKGLRDIITHHYFDVNAEAIYNVCDTKIPLLQNMVASIIEDLNSLKLTFRTSEVKSC
jgi:uncharacterized protein with HEPN domain